MPSEQIETIYKKLVQSYANAYPSNSLWVLNTRIDAYIRHEWNAREPAILDLALREGVEIPEVKELIEKGKTRKEAILEVSKNMKLQVSETEVEKWLKEVGKEKPRKVRKTAKQKMEQEIKDYEKTTEEETVKLKRELFELPTPPPAAPTKRLGLKSISKYFIHGFAFSILFLILSIAWALIFALLVALGFIIGLIIGLGLLFLMIGFLNSVITDLLWFTVAKSFWRMLFHGFGLFIILLIVQGIFIWIPNTIFPSIYVQIITFIIGTFLNGLVGKTVAGVWKEEIED